jgi:hypothetical protein
MTHCSFEIPRYVRFVDEFPATEIQKFVMRECASCARGGGDAPCSSNGTIWPIERLLMENNEVLGTHAIANQRVLWCIWIGLAERHS